MQVKQPLPLLIKLYNIAVLKASLQRKMFSELCFIPKYFEITNDMVRHNNVKTMFLYWAIWPLKDQFYDCNENMTKKSVLSRKNVIFIGTFVWKKINLT